MAHRGIMEIIRGLFTCPSLAAALLVAGLAFPEFARTPGDPAPNPPVSVVTPDAPGQDKTGRSGELNPDRQSELAAVPLRYDAVRLTWRDTPPEGGGYRIERREGDTLAWQEIAVTEPAATTGDSADRARFVLERRGRSHADLQSRWYRRLPSREIRSLSRGREERGHLPLHGRAEQAVADGHAGEY